MKSPFESTRDLAFNTTSNLNSNQILTENYLFKSFIMNKTVDRVFIKRQSFFSSNIRYNCKF